MPGAGLPRTARVLIATTPLFAPLYAATAFAVAYQSGQGLDEGTISLLASVAALLSLPFFFAGAWASERFGRLASLSLFDLAGFLAPALLMAAAPGPTLVAAAVLLLSVSQGAQAPGQSLLLEHARPNARSRILSAQRLLLVVSTAPLPLAAAFAVREFGLVAAVRALYALGALGVVLMVAARWFLLRGPRPVPLPIPRPSFASFRGLSNGPVIRVMAATTLIALAGGLGILAQLRILDRLHVEAFWLGPLAVAGTLTDVVATLLAVRARSTGVLWARLGILLSLVATAVFLLARGPWLLVLSYAIAGVSGAWLGIGTTAWLHDAIPEAARERAVALQLALRTAGSTLGPVLGGILYLRYGDAPWVAALGAFALVALLLWAPPRADRPTATGPRPTARNT